MVTDLKRAHTVYIYIYNMSMYIYIYTYLYIYIYRIIGKESKDAPSMIRASRLFRGS